jgi:hypothetical protein
MSSNASSNVPFNVSAGSLRSLVNSLDTVTDIFEKRATGIDAHEREVTTYFKLVQTSTLNKLLLEIMTCKSNAFHEERIVILLTVQYFCACCDLKLPALKSSLSSRRFVVTSVSFKMSSNASSNVPFNVKFNFKIKI